MRTATGPKKIPFTTGSPPKKLRKHLRRLLKKAWRDYRKSFTVCQADFSEASVHRLRVESRRLLALLDLIQPLVSPARTELPRRLVKKLLHRFARLRDTQVILQHIVEKQRAFPEVKPFRDASRACERRLLRRVTARMRDARLGKIRAAMAALREELRRVLIDQPHERQRWALLCGRIDQAFAKTCQLRDLCQMDDAASIHRMRVAFKGFRYMVELLHPLLPGVPKRVLDDLRSFQGRMGEIQDAEVLLLTLDGFCRKKPESAAGLLDFRRGVERRRGVMMRQFLANAGRLNQFWPPDPGSPHRPLPTAKAGKP